MEEAPRFKLLTLLVIVDTIEGLHNHFLGPERPPQCIIIILCSKSPAPPHTVEYTKHSFARKMKRTEND